MSHSLDIFQVTNWIIRAAGKSKFKRLDAGAVTLLICWNLCVLEISLAFGWVMMIVATTTQLCTAAFTAAMKKMLAKKQYVA